MMAVLGLAQTVTPMSLVGSSAFVSVEFDTPMTNVLLSQLTSELGFGDQVPLPSADPRYVCGTITVADIDCAGSVERVHEGFSITLWMQTNSRDDTDMVMLILEQVWEKHNLEPTQIRWRRRPK